MTQALKYAAIFQRINTQVYEMKKCHGSGLMMQIMIAV
jgi:hypothetical protein